MSFGSSRVSVSEQVLSRSPDVAAIARFHLGTPASAGGAPALARDDAPAARVARGDADPRGPIQPWFQSYGMGMYRDDSEGETVFGHPGGHPSGAIALWLSAPERDVRRLAQCGSFEGDPKPIAERALRALLGK